ncbi:MAG: NUDIX domain-containing protein [Clostridiales bacterium]|nr:NUDIX domain-containing protein [Clostridiales bacterium]
MKQVSARNSAKAIVLHENKILLNRCISRYGEYFALPGGGQHNGELLTETVRRELLEETGYTVSPIRLSGLYERVSSGRDDGMNHKIYFVFLCKLDDVPRKEPTETDKFQLGMEWLDVNAVRVANLFPRAIRDNIFALIDYGETIFLGSERDRF